MAVLETPAEDYEILEMSEDESEDKKDTNKVARVVTSRDDFMATVKVLESHDRNIEQSDLQFLAENEIALDEASEQKLERLIEALEEDDDVDTVRHNAG